MARAGISGVAVLSGTLGAWLVYAGVRDVPIVDGLREILSGETPTGRERQVSSVDWRGLSRGIVGAGGTSGTVASTDPNNWRYNLHPQFAASLEKLRDASNGKVILNPGAGWRSSARQIELRRINGCPDIHRSPASSCRVPTARPGNSKHEEVPATAFDLAFGAPRSQSVRWAHMYALLVGIHFPVRGEDWHAEPRSIPTTLQGALGMAGE